MMIKKFIVKSNCKIKLNEVATDSYGYKNAIDYLIYYGFFPEERYSINLNNKHLNKEKKKIDNETLNIIKDKLHKFKTTIVQDKLKLRELLDNDNPNRNKINFFKNLIAEKNILISNI